MPITKQQIAAFLAGAALMASVAYMLWVSSAYQQHRIMTALELLSSERDINSAQTIKALKSLREGSNEEAILFMEVWVGGQLKLGASDQTLEKAKEYQRAYCKDKCLGLQ